ncbi:MAG: hypothetical protein KDK64_05155 [Chlamydiia bacterium]|nr:hypothetical protein [Chlamydiia bacterium]
MVISSERQAEIWRQKAILLDEYIGLDAQDKKLKLMTLSIKKLAHFKGVPVPRVDSVEDLDFVHLWVSNEVKRDGIVPSVERFRDGSIDVVSSIVATVNKYFASKEFQSQAKVQSVSEHFWNTYQESEYIYPFATDSEELYTMVGMGLPFLTPYTVYHEVGIGSGEGILEMIRRGVKENRLPGCIVGTDINKYSLESLKLLIEEGFGGLDNIFLRRANASEPIDMSQLGFSPNVFVVAANRFFFYS